MMKAEEDIDNQLRNEFILHQLLLVASVLDLSDEVGRLVTSIILIASFCASLRKLLHMNTCTVPDVLLYNNL